MSRCRRWTQQEIVALVEYCAFKEPRAVASEWRDFARRLGRRSSAVHRQALRLGLLRRGRRKPWTDEEVQYVVSIYPDTATEAIARQINRTEMAVKRKMTEMGIPKSEEFRLKHMNKMVLIFTSYPPELSGAIRTLGKLRSAVKRRLSEKQNG